MAFNFFNTGTSNKLKSEYTPNAGTPRIKASIAVTGNVVTITPNSVVVEDLEWAGFAVMGANGEVLERKFLNLTTPAALTFDLNAYLASAIKDEQGARFTIYCDFEPTNKRQKSAGSLANRSIMVGVNLPTEIFFDNRPVI